MGNRVSGWIGLGFGSGRDKEARLGLVGRPVRRPAGPFGPAWGGCFISFFVSFLFSFLYLFYSFNFCFIKYKYNS